MQKKCVYACKKNYLSEIPKSDKISVYHFPKDKTEKKILLGPFLNILTHLSCAL